MARNPAVLVSLLADWDGKDLEKAQREIAKLQAQTQTMSSKFAAFGGQMQKFGKQVSHVGANLTKSVTLPIVGLGVAATKMAMDFDTSLTKMVSLVGLTREEVDGMRGDIIAMASQYGKSASEAADAMFFITSAGLRGADAMETLEASLKGAAIGLGDVQTIADLATSAMNAYGASNLSATKATSILRTAVEQGKLESDALAGSMGSVLPIASALGVGFDEAAAAMAAMSRTGTNASEAATQVRGILSQITKETPKGTKALKSVGLSYKGLRKQLREEGLLATLQTLKEAFGGNTVATAAFFGNIRALTGVMDMLGAGADTTEQIFAALAETTADDLDPALAAASETTGFQLQQAFATLKNSLIEFGDIIAPFVQQLAERLKSIGEAFQGLSPQAKQMIVVFGAIAAAIGPVLLIVGQLITSIGAIVAVINPLTLKIVLVVAAVAALAAGFVYLWNNSETLRTTVMAAFDSIRATVMQVVDMLKAKLKENEQSIHDLKMVFSAIAQFIADVLAPAFISFYSIYLKTLILVIGSVIERLIALVGFFLRVARTVIEVAKNFDEFKQTVQQRIDEVVAFIKTLPEEIKRVFAAAPTLLVQAGKDIIQGLLNGAGSLLPQIGNFFVSKLPGWMVGPFKSALGISSPSKVFERLGEQVMDGLEKGLANRSEKAVRKTKETAERLIEAAKTAIKEFEDYSASIQGSIVGLLDLGQAYEDFTSRQQAVTDTLAELTQYQSEIQGKATDEQKARLLELQKAYQDAQASAAAGAQSIVDEFIQQGERIRDFNDNLNKLLQAGLSKQAFDAIVAQGLERGADIAAALVDGNIQENARRVSDVYDSVSLMGQQTGDVAASAFMSAGAKLAIDMLEAFIKEVMPGGKSRNRLLAAIRELDKSIKFEPKYIDIIERRVGGGAPPPAPSVQVPSEVMQPGPSNPFASPGIVDLSFLGGLGIPAFAGGGIVTGPTLAMVGEAGPEAIVPLTGRRAAPGGMTFNVTVNAGMGTDGAEVGRHIVDAIRAYERRNGAVYATA